MTGDSGERQVAKALSLRARYKLPGADGTQVIPLNLLGVHPENRDGTYPPAPRVQDLMCRILLSGFSKHEADHEGVCVQDLPPEQHAAFQQKWNRPYTTLRAYNVSKVQTVEPLRPAFNDASPVSFGTLSHSTLSLGLLCLRNGARWSLPEEHKNKKLETLVKQPGGEWCPAALARWDAALGEALQTGLRFEVLSWKLWLEEASGACRRSRACPFALRGHCAPSCAKELLTILPKYCICMYQF